MLNGSEEYIVFIKKQVKLSQSSLHQQSVQSVLRRNCSVVIEAIERSVRILENVVVRVFKQSRKLILEMIKLKLKLFTLCFRTLQSHQCGF